MTTPSWAAERFDPESECTTEERGPYPWEYRSIVEGHISRTFFDPGSVVDLQIYKPAPGWWTTAAFKMTRRNTQCLWYVAFRANGKNRMGGYVGRKTYGIWVGHGKIMHSSERQGVDATVITQGERVFTEELAKLSEEDRKKVLEESREDPPATSGEETSYVQELRDLAALRDEGILTEDEFKAKKAEILGLPPEQPTEQPTEQPAEQEGKKPDEQPEL